MNKLLKSVSLLGFSVVFLSACGKASDRTKVSQAPMKATAKQETLDLGKLNPEQRAQVERVALDVKNLMKLTEESDQVFQEVWEVFLNQQKSENLFKGINRALKSGYSEAGLPLAKSENEKEECKKASLKIEKSTELTQNEVKFQAPESYSLAEGSCAALPGSTMIYAMKDAQGRNYFAIKYFPQEEKTWVGGNISMYGFPVEKKAEGASADSAKKSTYIFEKVEKAVRCDMYMNEAGKLWVLTCMNLGHDDASDSAVVFKDLRWNSYSKEQSILASGLRVKVNMEKGPQVVSSFTIADSISKNEILISEKEVESGEEKTRAVPRKDESAPVVNTEIKEKAQPTAAASAADNEVKPMNEVTSSEPVMQSGDQAISPDQVGVDGEIVPLSDLGALSEQGDSSTQGIPSVR